MCVMVLYKIKTIYSACDWLASMAWLSWLSLSIQCRNINEQAPGDDCACAGCWLGPGVHVGRRWTCYNYNHHFFACDVECAGRQPTDANSGHSRPIRGGGVKKIPQSCLILASSVFICVHFKILCRHRVEYAFYHHHHRYQQQQ